MQRNVAALTEGTYDLLILGGGITGAGVALDAALRGLRVALIDKGDFASGTSGVSSKLIHGGLRYLEQAAFGLVGEALTERRRLLHNAPHLVRPLRFILPFYRGARMPPWKWRLGLTLYDILAGRGNLRRSQPLTARQLMRESPSLRSHGLIGGADYFDAQMDDARLCIEVVRTAARQGACVANYVAATAFCLDAGRITGVTAQDQVAGQELTIRARQVLNATGPWVDAVCRLAGDARGPHLRPTKGVHIVAPTRGLSAAFLLLHPRDGRVLFVIPWMGKTLIGTTDTFTTAGPDELRVLPEETAYLLEAHNHYFSPPLAERDMLGTFAGLRPLIRSRPGQPSALSREFRLIESPGGLLSAAGGKYTTYRHMAEEITDAVMWRLGRRRRCRTHDFCLDGAPAEPWTVFYDRETARLGREYALGAQAARHLVDRYGRRAADVAACLGATPNGARPIVAGEPDLQVELLYQRHHECAVYPDDHWLRRTRLGLFRRDIRAAVGGITPY